MHLSRGVLSVCFCSLCLLFQVGFYWSEVDINMTIIFETSSVVLHNYSCIDVMASGGGKAGKGGEEGPDAQVHWLGRDCCETKQGKPAAQVQPQPRTRKVPDCRNCEDLCCGLSRALVSEAFELGAITMSRKVSLGHSLEFGF